jgi:tRNA pseudouridine38-40 synthase
VGVNDESAGDDRVTVALRLGYDGRLYHGFVHQPGQLTVAGTLLAAIAALDADVAALRVSSRTDAGVHARAQLVAFDTARRLSPRGWVLALNQRLPDSVSVRSAHAVPWGFDPRFAVRSKRYRYLVHCARTPDPLWAGRVWSIHALAGAPARAAAVMRGEIEAARGTHDFAAFASARDRRAHTGRTLTTTEVELASAAPLVVVDLAGDGFLHHMVRILVGTAVDVARGRLAPGAVARAFVSRDRRTAGQTAPPGGLYLEEVHLDADPTTECWPPEATLT